MLHEYVDMMDFKLMRFDDAIRHYLSGFRLPGEAQKIDRMMEKFSERFCLQVCDFLTASFFLVKSLSRTFSDFFVLCM